MTYWKPLVVAPALIITSAQCFAVTYLTVEQAQKLIFPGANFSPADLSLTPAQKSAIEKASHVRLRKPPKIWRVGGGGWFIVDEVLGKHEFITFALGLTNKGAVKQIEIMDYRESYGYEIRDPKWRAQFVGQTAQAPLKLDQDIRNISGATLSSRHVTEGVRRSLALYEIALR
jgi:FMN-binding domain